MSLNVIEMTGLERTSLSLSYFGGFPKDYFIFVSIAS